MRKQSDATKLRHARHELRELRAKLACMEAELSERRTVGRGLSNICFNLAQNNHLSERSRETMRESQTLWDAIRRWDHV